MNVLVATWIITFLLIVGLGTYAGTRISKSSQWNGSDRSMGIFSVGAMLGAWQIGGMSIVGAAQNGYTMGIAGCWYSIAGGLYFLMMAALAKPMRKYMKASSLPVFLEERYGNSVSRVQAYIWIVFGILYIPIQLKTVASVIQIVLPGLNTGMAMFIGVTIAAVYTGFAGMKGSDIVGRIVCIATYVLLIWFVFTNLGSFGGYSGLVAQLPEGYGKLSAMPVQQIVAWALGGALTSIVSQAALQPMFAAKNDRSATLGCILGYVIAGPICILTAMVGMMSRARTDALGNGATAFAWGIADMSSPVMAGIIFAVITMIVAATMATMMMATGTVISNVYSKQINPSADDAHVLRVSRIGTIVVAYLSLIVGFVIPSAQMTNMFLTLNYLVYAPFSFTVIAGMFWKKVNAKASLISIAVGIVVALIWIFAGLNAKFNVVYPTIIASYLAGYLATQAFGDKNASGSAAVKAK
jgi:SSS family solute:Na+ symporter